jgi:hypothetical protein
MWALLIIGDSAQESYNIFKNWSYKDFQKSLNASLLHIKLFGFSREEGITRCSATRSFNNWFLIVFEA